MEPSCDERKKREKLEMMLKEVIAGAKDWRDLWEFRQNNGEEWFDKEVICYVLREDVLELKDWHKLDLYIIGDIRLSSAVNVQNEFKQLIYSMDNKLNTKQCEWNRHGKLFKVIDWVLWKCKDRYESHDSSSEQVYAQILDYLMKLVERCDDEKTVDRALRALGEFPFNKYQSTLIMLIDSVGIQLTKPSGWNKQVILCQIIVNILENCWKQLSERAYDQLFDYLKKIIDQSEDEETIDHALSGSKKFPFKQILTRLIRNSSQLSQLNWKMHHDLLKKLIQKYYYMVKVLQEDSVNLWFEYLRNILHKCDHMKLVLHAILIVEELCLREHFDVDSEDVLKSELMGRVQSLDSECPLAHSLPDEFDFDRYQVEWCARWCVHNVMDRHKRKEMGGELPLVKLSNNEFEARSDRTDYYPIPVRSQYSVTSGVYFYEVTIGNKIKMLGWSTRDAELDGFELDRIFDVTQRLYSHKDGDFIFVNLPDCHRGDVIGCLIDMDNRRFVFYYNGKEVVSVDDESLDKEKNPKQITFSSSRYYATAILSLGSHCYFNFGQTPFKFAPDNIQFMDFHKASGKNERKYRLSETNKIDIIDYIFWFKHLPVDNQVDLFHRDKRQNECDELVKRVERDIAEGREVEEMKMELGCTRYIQAIFEEMGKTIQKDKIDLMAQWVGRVIDETIDRVNLAKPVQLIYPYLHLRINSTIDTKHRNICIVLSNLIRFSEYYGYDFIESIRNEVLTYLTRTLTETSDQWTQLFGLIALDYLKLSDHEKKMIQEDTRIMTFFNNFEDSSKYSNAFEMSTLKHCRPLSYQLNFMSERFYRNVLNRPIGWNQSNQSALKIDDQTWYLKVSHDLLSVRSDWKWQSVRYDCTGLNRIDYFEVLLLTNGPMRIGWSTKRTDLQNGDKFGADEFSIVFNGYNRIILHQNTPSPTHRIPQWKAGDVVCCLMHISTGRFYFFLNGHPLPLPDKLYFSPHLPYYPSLSLSAHQQVYCNFGQSNFRYTQQNIENLELLLSIQRELRFSGRANTSIDLSHSSISNSFLAIKSKAKTRNITFNHQPQSTISSLNPNHCNKRDMTSDQFLTSGTCPKQIPPKRFKTDCCEHKSKPQPVGSTSPIIHEHGAQQQNFVLIEEITQLKLRNAELEKDYQELKKDLETMKAQKCDSLSIVHAECCDHLKFCTKCGSAMGSCVAAKCNRK